MDSFYLVWGPFQLTAQKHRWLLWEDGKNWCSKLVLRLETRIVYYERLLACWKIIQEALHGWDEFYQDREIQSYSFGALIADWWGPTSLWGQLWSSLSNPTSVWVVPAVSLMRTDHLRCTQCTWGYYVKKILWQRYRRWILRLKFHDADVVALLKEIIMIKWSFNIIQVDLGLLPRLLQRFWVEIILSDQHSATSLFQHCAVFLW